LRCCRSSQRITLEIEYCASWRRLRTPDVDSTLGGIRRASQGIFEILPRDAAPGISEAGQIDKKIRVVSTIEYLLEP
jgi:hypothetical protein